MDCVAQLPLVSKEYFQAFTTRTLEQRVPVSGALDLTYRCNLRCVHCYAGHLVSQPAQAAEELSTAQILRILEEAASAGCLKLLLSGGEPLLRPDFTEIYIAARRLGLLVTVFTNATLLTPEHADALREYPPRMVEISLYGATQGTYERVTRVPGSYIKAMRGMALLQERGVPVGLKTMILKDNLEEVEAIEALARHRGLRFRLDPVVTPRLNGDPAPLAQRVDPEQAVELELADEPRRAALLAYWVRQKALYRESRPGERRYMCAAGRSTFHVDPAGAMRPCLTSREFAYDWKKLGFAQAWRRVNLAVDQAVWCESDPCATCADVMLCGYCAGLIDLESGRPPLPSDYLCRLGTNRRRILEQEEVVHA